MVKEVNKIERSKTDTFKYTTPEKLFYDLIIITALFGCYISWIPRY